MQTNFMTESDSASGKVVNYVVSKIADRELNIGDRLLPERDLAAQLDVSRASVREGLKVLNYMGFINSSQGSGNYVSDDYTRTVQNMMYIMFQRGDITFDQITVFRQMLEEQAVVLAIRNITREQKDELKKIVDLMDTSGDENILFELDRRLHTIIAEASLHPLIVTTFKALTTVLYRYMGDSFHNIVSKRTGGFETLQKYHHAIVDAVLAGDEEAGRKAMEGHFGLLIE